MVLVRDPRGPSDGAAVFKAALEAAGLEARYVPYAAPPARNGAGQVSSEFALFVGSPLDTGTDGTN